MNSLLSCGNVLILSLSETNYMDSLCGQSIKSVHHRHRDYTQDADIDYPSISY